MFISEVELSDPFFSNKSHVPWVELGVKNMESQIATVRKKNWI
jgi:hypothetical protein